MRERLLLDKAWRFALGHAADASLDFEFARDRSLVKAGEARGAASPKFDDAKWRQVDLPHDWAIELPLEKRDDREHVEHGSFQIGPDFPQHSVGWYRRTFAIPKSDEGRRIEVEFDGVFRDAVVWINGHRLGRRASGYTPFRFDVTDQVIYGEKNVLVVRCDASQVEGWWYEGAGIYRHVWLEKTSPLRVEPDGVWIRATPKKSTAEVKIVTTISHHSVTPLCDSKSSDKIGRVVIRHEVIDADGKVVAKANSRAAIGPDERIDIESSPSIRNAKLWSCDEPNLYTLRTTIEQNGKPIDVVENRFGVRSLRWDAKRGFFLNGKHTLIKGTCNHRDHAGVGAAVPDRIHRLRIEKLKELGSNAFRCAHYMHARELLDACDELGMLVMCENRLASSADDCLRDFETMIRRDRNRPGVILWSIGNEEHSVQWARAGERIGSRLVRLAHKLDPTRKVTAAMHDRGLGEGFANVVDVHGWNYMKVGDIEAFHKRRPTQPIVGSEESSTVTTRGEYRDDASRGYVSAYDVRTPGWGTTAEKWWTFFRARPWLAGGFVWTGFDYRGEPIPYRWPCTASHFGLMDLCGFPKDLYWYYKAWWSNEPVLHVFPHWNFAGHEGREIDVWCYTNFDFAELFVNGKSLGEVEVKRDSHAAWKAIYDPGEIEVVGRSRDGKTMRRRVETTGPATSLELIADRNPIRADGEDVACVTVRALDERGRFVPIANDLVRFEIDGAGKLIGVGNGDPSSHESDKASFRKLFNGLALAIVQAGDKRGAIHISATAEGLSPAAVTVSVRGGKPRPRA